MLVWGINEDADLAQIGAWYDEAARAAYEGRSLEELCASTQETGSGLLTIGQLESEELIGVVEYRRDGDWLAVPFIVLAKAYRGWGYGSEVVRLVEEWAVRGGLAERSRANVDVRNGLGLYFWLRLGYRPEGAARDGKGQEVLAMVREAT